jgi:hypothetical protein
VQRNFSTRGRPGNFTGEGFYPGPPGYAGRNVIRLPDSSYTGDPGPLWRKTARGKFGEEIVFVESDPGGTGNPEAELGKETGDGETSGTTAMSGAGSQPQVAHGPEAESEPAPELEPQGEPERKPLIWKAFPE